MGLEREEILKVNSLIFEYIIKLNDQEIKELLSGEKKMALFNNKNKVKKETCIKVNNSINVEKINNIIEVLNSCSTREDGIDYLKNNKFTVKELKQIARVGEIFIKSKSKKAEIIERLIEGTVGANIKMKVLKEG